MKSPWHAAPSGAARNPPARAALLAAAAAFGAVAALATPSPALVCSPSGPHSLQSLATVDGDVILRSDAALADTVWLAPIGGDAAQVSFDYVHGDLVAAANGTSSYDVKLSAPDRFELVGVPEGVPVTLGVEFRVSVSGCCDGTFLLPWIHAAIDGTDGPEELTTASVDLTQSLTGTVSLAGWAREFWLGFLLEGGNGMGYGGAARVTGHWRFTGLPAGASLVSCKSFAGEAVPARPTSWGAVKALYR
jgi:hypothetical protein